MSQRSITLDALRAISILYIVGYWHLFNYTNYFPEFYNRLTVRLTVSVLGLFVLLSGIFAGRALAPEVGLGAIEYYKRRLAKIYPAFIVALLVYGLINLADWPTVIKGIALISMFDEPAPPTLWFIAMIIIFYFISPLLRNNSRFASSTLSASLIIYSIFILYEAATGNIDRRLLIYFPCYAVGFYIGYHQIAHISNSRLLVALLVAAVIISAFDELHIEHSVFSTPLAVIGSLCLLECLSRIRYENFSHAIHVLSSASFLMYLSHRPVFTILRKLYFPADGFGQLLYLGLFCLPVVIAVSYYMNILLERSRSHSGASTLLSAEQ